MLPMGAFSFSIVISLHNTRLTLQFEKLFFKIEKGKKITLTLAGRSYTHQVKKTKQKTNKANKNPTSQHQFINRQDFHYRHCINALVYPL